MIAVQHCGTLARRGRAPHWLWFAMAFASAVATSGCGSRPLYNWGRYEDSLHASYIGHDEAKASADLEATITAAQQTGQRIPPGVCAEYGFLLYKRGQRDRAVALFQQEAQLFPESKPLMDRLIAKIRERSAADPNAAAQGGLEQ